MTRPHEELYKLRERARVSKVFCANFLGIHPYTFSKKESHVNSWTADEYYDLKKYLLEVIHIKGRGLTFVPYTRDKYYKPHRWYQYSLKI